MMPASERYSQEPYLLEAGPLGWVEGLTIHDSSVPSRPASCHYFGGLPYALPPVGKYRFRQARPLPEDFRYGTKASPGRYTTKAAVCPQPAFQERPNQSLWDENCLQLNIYIPAGEPPKQGWSVFFYIHGGFLQFGSPNLAPAALAPLLGETAFKSIIVAPAYRVNAFGFLASRELEEEALSHGEPSGNMGFWDQRLALEFTSTNIKVFGGDSSNITVGGYSAGSHSTYQQLAHELYFVPDESAIIKRIIMWSNSPGVQPKTLSEQQKQFDELLTVLGIPPSLPADDKLAKLRSITPAEMVLVQDKMKISEFRALSDGNFIRKDIVARINNGDFAKRMKARGIKIMNGECRDEHFEYRAWRTPSPSFEAVFTRLCADYPVSVVKQLLMHKCPEQKLPPGAKDWQEAFGRLYADMQVHCLERGFQNALVNGGLQPGKDIYRYRFDWRASVVDRVFPPEVGVTHGTDLAIWFWGLNWGKDGLTEDDKNAMRSWNEAFAAFVRGEELAWKVGDVKEVVRLRADGNTDVWVDDQWEEGLKLWRAVNGEAPTGVWGWIKSKL